MAKRQVPLYDFAAFGQAIKAARTARKESRKDVSDAMNISPRYLTNIENHFLVVKYQMLIDLFHFAVFCQKVTAGESIFKYLTTGEKSDVITEYTLIDASNAAQYAK